jgi:rhodanese-related sulfurtransferase
MEIAVPVGLLGFTDFGVTPLLAQGRLRYRHMSVDELGQELKEQDPVVVLDIQLEPEYEQHHTRGAIPTYGYPVKSAEGRAKLDAALPKVEGSIVPVVIVCPRGAGGAERASAYLKEKGVAEERLHILEMGQAGWNGAERTEGSGP